MTIKINVEYLSKSVAVRAYYSVWGGIDADQAYDLLMSLDKEDDLHVGFRLLDVFFRVDFDYLKSSLSSLFKTLNETANLAVTKELDCTRQREVAEKIAFFEYFSGADFPSKQAYKLLNEISDDEVLLPEGLYVREIAKIAHAGQLKTQVIALATDISNIFKEISSSLMANQKLMDIDEWVDRFKPVPNFSPYATSPMIGELMFGFETFGRDAAHVRSVHREMPNHVWTMLENPCGEVVIVPALQHEISNLITEEPWFDVDLIIL